MKFKLIIAAFICSLTIVSCSKEDIENRDTIPQAKSSSGITKVSFSGSGLEDMLSFPDMAYFVNTQSNLEIQVEDHDDNFVSQYGNMSEDDLIDFEEDSNFDDELPLTEFESIYSFQSLRRHLINAENAWLDQFGPNDNFDVSESPYHHFIMDEAMRAMLNVDAQAQIGEYLTQFTRFGYIQVPVNNLELFLNVVNDPAGTTGWMNHSEVTVVGGYYGSPAGNFDPQSLDPDTNGVFCVDDINDKGQINFTDNRKVSWEHKLRGSYVFVKAKAKTRGFKHKRGKWRCRRLNISVGLNGDISSNQTEDCEVYKNLGKSRSRKKRRIKVKDEELHFSGSLIKYKAINRETVSSHGWSSHSEDVFMLDL